LLIIIELLQHFVGLSSLRELELTPEAPRARSGPRQGGVAAQQDAQRNRGAAQVMLRAQLESLTQLTYLHLAGEFEVDFSVEGGMWSSIQLLSQLRPRRLTVRDSEAYFGDPQHTSGAAVGAAIAQLTRLTRLDLLTCGLLAAAPYLAALPQLVRMSDDAMTLHSAMNVVQGQLTALTHVCVGLGLRSVSEGVCNVLPDLTRHSQLAGLELEASFVGQLALRHHPVDAAALGQQLASHSAAEPGVRALAAWRELA
jgi:hypothetical protein